MPKRRGQKAVDRTKFLNYQKVAEHFYNAAKDSLELEYWTASGVLIVHSAIAFSPMLFVFN